MTANHRIRVEEVETMLLDLPTVRSHRLAMTTMQHQTLVLVRLRTADGIVGWGEGTTIGGLSYGDESPEGIKLAIDAYIAPIVQDQGAASVAATMLAVDRHVRGNHHAKNAVETALLDALGRQVGLPISELLGGRVRDQLDVAWTLASGETARDIVEAEAMLAEGRHRIFKVKIGMHDPKTDVAHVAAIKRAVGDRGSVRVDVNQAWDEATAGWAVGALASAGVDLVEQPVPRERCDVLARLTARGAIAIMADEALRGPADALALAVSRAANVFAVKIAPSGGPRAAVRVAAIGDAAGIGLYGGTMLEGAIGTAASAHVFSTFPRLAWGTELFGPLLLTEEIARAPLTHAGGTLVVPSGPGLGVEVDEERVFFYRRDRRARTKGGL